MFPEDSQGFSDDFSEFSENFSEFRVQDLGHALVLAKLVGSRRLDPFGLGQKAPYIRR